MFHVSYQGWGEGEGGGRDIEIFKGGGVETIEDTMDIRKFRYIT